MVDKVTKANLDAFLSRKPYSVIHFDAEWDGYRHTVSKNMGVLQPLMDDQVSFGYVDIDENQDLAMEIRLLNVPCVAYYHGKNLYAIVVGIKQDLADNVAKMKQGEPLDTSNSTSRG